MDLKELRKRAREGDFTDPRPATVISVKDFKMEVAGVGVFVKVDDVVADDKMHVIEGITSITSVLIPPHHFRCHCVILDDDY